MYHNNHIHTKSMLNRQAVSKYKDLEIFDPQFASAFITTFYNVFKDTYIHSQKHMNFLFNKYIDIYKNQYYFDIPNSVIMKFYSLDSDELVKDNRIYNKYL